MRATMEKRSPEPAQPQLLPHEIDDIVDPDFLEEIERPTAAEILSRIASYWA